MNVILTKHIEADKRESWGKSWDASGGMLEPFYLALLELAGDGVLTEDDFKGADSSAIQAFRAGQRRAYLKVLALLPESAKPLGKRVPLLTEPCKPWYSCFEHGWKIINPF